MNLVIDNTLERDEANTELSFAKTESDNAIYIIQITNLDGPESEVLSRYTHNEYFTSKESAELKIEILKGKLGAGTKLFFIQTLFPHGAGPKLTVVN